MYLNSTSFNEGNFLHHSLDFNASVWVLKFLKIKKERSNFWEEPILQNVWIIWYSLLYSNFKSFKDPNSLSLIRSQCILYNSGVPVSEFWNFYYLKMGDLISRENKFCKTPKLFGHPFCLSISKVSRSQILHHLLDFSACLWFRST